MAAKLGYGTIQHESMEMSMNRKFIAGLVIATTLIVQRHADATEPEEQKSPSMSLLGIPLGEALSSPECRFSDFGMGQQYLEQARQTELPCWRHIPSSDLKPGSPLEAQNATVFIYAKDLPDGITRQGLMGPIVAGKLEVLYVPTDGAKHQVQLAASLVEKYGKPTEDSSGETQNRMGAKFHQIAMTWRFSDLTVQFHGLSGSIDKGVIYVTTNAGQAYMADEIARKKARQPKL